MKEENKKMMVLKETVEFRCESEEEAKSIIEKIKEEGSSKGYEITAWDVKKRDKKAKGEVIDTAYLTKVVKTYGGLWD